MEVWAVTDKGRVRARNEDAVTVVKTGSDSQVLIMAVADGIGGHRGGEMASRIAVERAGCYLEESLRNLNAEHDPLAVLQSLAGAIAAANAGIISFSSSSQMYRGMGTTLTVAIVSDGRAYLGHVGDSRAYLIRKTEIFQLTEDHNVVGELLKEGRISEMEAAFHPHRHLLTRALGVGETAEADVCKVDLIPDDILLMCTDGLTGLVEPEEILNEVTVYRGQLDRLPLRLVEMANERGGFDNVTVALCRYTP